MERTSIRSARMTTVRLQHVNSAFMPSYIPPSGMVILLNGLGVINIRYHCKVISSEMCSTFHLTRRTVLRSLFSLSNEICIILSALFILVFEQNVPLRYFTL